MDATNNDAGNCLFPGVLPVRLFRLFGDPLAKGLGGPRVHCVGLPLFYHCLREM